jgi:hypothetical protein
MSEIPALLRELIEEIQGLRSDLSEVRGLWGTPWATFMRS